ncbi:MAG: hypothetical protein WBC78_19725 [Candidatus Sulfotelmatobacter sp.]
MNITGTTFSSCTIYLIDPIPPSVNDNWGGCTQNGYFGPFALNQNGTYSFGIIPGSSSGSLTLSLSVDTSGTIAINGPAVTATTTVTGQDARLTFEATGQRIVVYATNVSNQGALVNLVTPSGSTQANMFIDNSPAGQTFFLDTQALGFGTYQLWVQHDVSNVGSETLQIASVPADYSKLLPVPGAGKTGAAVRVPGSGNLAVGQNASLTINGTLGEKLSFNLSSTIGTNSGSCFGTLYDPNGAIVLNGPAGYCGVGATYIDTVKLALTGTYTLYLDPQGTATGTITVSINNDQDVTTPTISIGGSAVTATTAVAGQDIRLSFTPTASQPRIAVLATNVTTPGANLNLWNGTSTQSSAVISNNPSGQTFFIDTQSVTSGQQYQLWVQHSGTYIGSETLQIVNVPADISHTVTVGGAAYALSTVIGQNANITFTTTASEAVTINWTSGTYPTALGCSIIVTGPSPSTNQVGSGSCNAATGTINLGTLSAGTYNIFVNPQAQSAGGLSMTVITP